MYSCPIVNALLLALLISNFVVANLYHVKSSKEVFENRFSYHAELEENDEESHLMTKGEVISESDEETTSKPIEISDNDVEEVPPREPSYRYEDEFETLGLTFLSTDSDEFKDGGSSNQSSPGLERLLNFISEHHYNPSVIPKQNRTQLSYFKPGDYENYPITVRMYLTIRYVSNIDEIDGHVSLEIDLKTEWWDGKLWEWYNNRNVGLREEYRQTWPKARHSAPLLSNVLQKFWTPDIFIEKLANVSTSKILSRSERLTFWLRGKFSYRKRMTVKVNCEMDFTYYPADTQKCDFILRSYSYKEYNLELVWGKPEGVYLMQTDDSNFDLQVCEVVTYKLLSRPKRKCNDTGECHTKWERFHALRFTLHMRRKLSYQLLQTYIPSALYIAITWLCFMIPREMVECRIAIAMTTLLTLTNMFSSVRLNTPIVSYVKAIDIWMVAGITFIFFVVLEFTVLLWVEAGTKSREQREENEGKLDLGSERAAEHGNRRELPQSASAMERVRKEQQDTKKGKLDHGIERAAAHVNTRELPESMIDMELVCKEQREANEGNLDVGCERVPANGNRGELPESATVRVRGRKWLLGMATKVIGVVEEYSFELILLIITSFNIVYWTWLFVASGYFSWSIEDRHNANSGRNKHEDEMGDQLPNPW